MSGRAIGYCRVSTQGQADDGVSMDAQQAKIAAWADLNGYALASVFADAGISGAKADRPGLLAALDAVGKGDALVIYSLSRLARSTRQTLDIADRLQRVGADLVSLSERIDTTTAAGKMVFRMLAVMSEFERDLAVERTTMALAHKRAKGEKTGGDVPYGFALAGDGVALVEHPGEQDAIRVVQLLRAGGMSLAAIGRELEARGHHPRSGGSWHPQQVKRMVA